MGDLARLQANFQQYLLQRNPLIQSAIATTPKISTALRLEIYHDAYYLRLLEVLESDYIALRVLIGEDEFDKLGRSYINQYPSHYRSVRWFGENLLSFLQQSLPYSQNSLLIEMAEFEWSLNEAFDVVDSPLFLLEHMATIPVTEWPDLQFTLHPSVKRLAFHWNTVALWKAAKAQEELKPQHSDEAMQWLVWRKDVEVQFCSLTADEAYFIDALIADNTFGEICEGLCEWIAEESVPMHAATLLKRFIMDGLLINSNGSSCPIIWRGSA